MLYKVPKNNEGEGNLLKVIAWLETIEPKPLTEEEILREIEFQNSIVAYPTYDPKTCEFGEVKLGKEDRIKIPRKR